MFILLLSPDQLELYGKNIIILVYIPRGPTLSVILLLFDLEIYNCTVDPDIEFISLYL
jgi:hypothetical protein